MACIDRQPKAIQSLADLFRQPQLWGGELAPRHTLSNSVLNDVDEFPQAA